METWRLLLHEDGPPAWNMAIDEALLRCGAGPVLRLYGWRGPAQSLGYFQPSAEAMPDIPFVRRYTGGGLVDHRRDVTYTVVMPRTHPLAALGLTESYRRLHQAVAAAMADAGLPAATIVETEDPVASTACFQRAVKHDVKLGRTKAAGAAQRRTRHGLLHQGSILPPAAGQRDAIRASLAPAIARLFGVAIEPSSLTDAEIRHAHQLEASRYALASWNFRL
jgi:lipoate-protein ligase A